MLRRIGFRARDLAARLEALRTGFFRRDAVRFVMVGSLGFTIEFGILVALVWRKLQSVSCASSRHGNGFFLHLAAASALDLRIWTGEVSPLPQSLLYGTFQ